MRLNCPSTMNILDKILMARQRLDTNSDETIEQLASKIAIVIQKKCLTNPELNTWQIGTWNEIWGTLRINFTSIAELGTIPEQIGIKAFEKACKDNQLEPQFVAERDIHITTTKLFASVPALHERQNVTK